LPVGIGPDGAGSNPSAFVFSGFCMDFAWHCAGRVWAGARAKAAFYRVPGAFFFGYRAFLAFWPDQFALPPLYVFLALFLPRSRRSFFG